MGVVWLDLIDSSRITHQLSPVSNSNVEFKILIGALKYVTPPYYSKHSIFTWLYMTCLEGDFEVSAQGPYFCPLCPHFQVIVQPWQLPTNSENLMPKKVPTCLHLNEWCGVVRQRNVAPLNERMPAMCGCAQAFGAGMCWNAGSGSFPPTAFPGVTGKGKQQNHETEMDRPWIKKKKKKRVCGCRWKTPSSLIRKSLSRHEVTHIGTCCQDM